MEIREARKENGGRITEMHREVVRKVNSKDYSEEEVREWLAEITLKDTEEEVKTTNSYVATINGEVVGYGSFSDDGELYQIYVDPEHIRKGIGTLLVHEVEEKAREKRIEELYGNTTLTAKGFYEKKGYKLGKKINYPLDEHSIKMIEVRKKLD